MTSSKTRKLKHPSETKSRKKKRLKGQDLLYQILKPQKRTTTKGLRPRFWMTCIRINRSSRLTIFSYSSVISATFSWCCTNRRVLTAERTTSTSMLLSKSPLKLKMTSPNSLTLSTRSWAWQTNQKMLSRRLHLQTKPRVWFKTLSLTRISPKNHHLSLSGETPTRRNRILFRRP